jgi:hypothetical protein
MQYAIEPTNDFEQWIGKNVERRSNNIFWDEALHLPVGTVETNYESHDSRSSDRYLNPGPLEYQACMPNRWNSTFGESNRRSSIPAMYEDQM